MRDASYLLSLTLVGAGCTCALFLIFVAIIPFILNPELLTDLVSFKMPFGKYKDRLIADLPEPYLVWYSQKGFPKGKLGMLLQTMYEIKLNGLEYLLKPLRK